MIKIKGIGPETIADIKRVYSNMDELKKAIKNNQVPLRNDKVNILKKELKI